MIRLSKAANKLVGQPMFNLLTKAKELEERYRKIIHYEIGDPIFNTPINIVEAAKKALDENKTHYTSSSGLPEFREAIRKYIDNYYGFRPLLEQVVACPANAAIDFVCKCVADPGDEIIYPDPGFPTYYSSILYNGFIPVPVSLKRENEFRMNPKNVKELISSKTRLIIINSPHNPTGSVMTTSEIEGIYDIAKKHNIFILSDEVYSRIIYDRGFISPSKMDFCKERTIILQSLSKVYSMAGWRLGYVIAPFNLAEKLSLLLQTVLSCLPPFIQIAGIEALNGKDHEVNRRIHKLKLKRDSLIRGLNSLKGISCFVPHGAFYAFPSITETGMTCDEYSNELLEKTGVCVLPGNCFGKEGEGYIRLSYASVSFEDIEESLEKMNSFHRNF